MSRTKAETLGTVPRKRWEFRIGATILAVDGVLGTLRQVVIQPGDQRVTGLIVRTRLLPPHDLLIPLEAVRHADAEGVQLAWTERQAHEKGKYDELAFHAPARSLLGYAAGEAAVSLRGGKAGATGLSGISPRGLPPIRVGLEVEALDGPAGRVREVLVDAANGRVTHFVMQHGILWKRDRLVPVEWVRAVTPDFVSVEATLADLIRLPEYRPDEDLRAEIVREWETDPEVRALRVHSALTAKVRDGVAVLQGYAWSRALKDRLEELALRVEGVLEVRNEVIADDELSLQVREALARDPRTRGVALQVDSYLGNVRIEGEAPGGDTREAIREAAAAVPHVKCVINKVRIQGDPQRSASQGTTRHNSEDRGSTRLVLSRGDRVRCSFGPLGVVDQVLIHPETREAAYLIVRGGRGLPKDTLIPVTWIHAVDANGILLGATYEQLLLAPEYADPASDPQLRETGQALSAAPAAPHGAPAWLHAQAHQSREFLEVRARA